MQRIFFSLKDNVDRLSQSGGVISWSVEKTEYPTVKSVLLRVLHSREVGMRSAVDFQGNRSCGLLGSDV